MTNEFKQKSPSARKFRKWLKTLGPKQFKYATAGYLNTLAFQMKDKHMPDTLEDNMNIRDPKFMHRMLRVNKARPSDGARMKSEAGSAAIGKFRGWEEQETGKAAKNRVHSLFSQTGGTEKGKIRPSQRLNQGNQLIDPLKVSSKYHKTPGQKNVRALIGMRKGRIKRMVKLSRKGLVGNLHKLKSGVYQHSKKSAGGFARLWNFEKDQTTKKILWNEKSETELKRRADPRKIWKKEVKRQLKFKR